MGEGRGEGRGGGLGGGQGGEGEEPGGGAEGLEGSCGTLLWPAALGPLHVRLRVAVCVSACMFVSYRRPR